MKRTYTHYSDPGHGWLAVPVKELHKFGVADKISRFSYRNGDTAYLEEDQDAPLFLAARGEVNIKSTHGSRRSRIRGYAPYTPDLDTAPKTGTKLVVERVKERPDALGEHLSTGFTHFRVYLWRNGEDMTIYLSANPQLAHRFTGPGMGFEQFVAAARRMAHLLFLSRRQIQGTYFCDEDRAERILAQARQVSNDLARLFPEEVICEQK